MQQQQQQPMGHDINKSVLTHGLRLFSPRTLAPLLILWRPEFSCCSSAGGGRGGQKQVSAYQTIRNGTIWFVVSLTKSETLGLGKTKKGGGRCCKIQQ
jgi:hypothetical protein